MSSYEIHCEVCKTPDPNPDSNIMPTGWDKRPIDPAMPQKGYVYRCPEHPFEEGSQ